MTSREAVLASVRRGTRPNRPVPELPAAVRYADPERQFADILVSVGGCFARTTGIPGADDALRQLDVYQQAQRVASLVDGIGTSNIDLSTLEDPHELEGIDLAIIPGEFAVAENAAVWVRGSALGPHRAIFVIAQHLVLVVPADAVLHNMQQAYQHIHLERAGFGVFISGPSKTADIEQSLVIGAHGPRSCTVLLI